MLPYPTLIPVDRASGVPVYLQVVNSIIGLAKTGLLPPGSLLPGSRALAGQLLLHRKTVVRAYDELLAQGWITQQASRGTFVSERLPETSPEPMPLRGVAGAAQHTGFQLHLPPDLRRPMMRADKRLGFDDGFPDVRLAPLDALGRTYRAILKRPFQRDLLSYSDPLGNAHLRHVLAGYLHQSRGLAVSAQQICITRGSVMGIHVAAQLICRPGDLVLAGDTTYLTASLIFRHLGAQLYRLPVDAHGISVEAVEELCRRQRVRLLYLTPHHHYPTTVTLPAERRVRLLQLANQYGFAILEDDYDYDFHYATSPILPLASADAGGMVVYVGSLSKAMAPAFRIGYIVAPPNLIEAAGYLRRILDRQGDAVLEQAVAELIAEGELKRHLKKAQRTYHQRRDVLCSLLKDQLGDRISFDPPTGGMAVWARFDKSLALEALASNARGMGLLLGSGTNYDAPPQNATRMGFASLTPDELEQAVAMLSKAIR